MARQYSTVDFFRHMPNAFLARYFQSKHLFSQLDFAVMRETKPDALIKNWLSLPDTQRGVLDAELRSICELCCEKGFRAIIDEAEWHFVTLKQKPDELASFVEMLSALPGHFERAMTTFLDYSSLWKGATHFYHADTLSFWRKRKNIPHVAAAVDVDSIESLARAIGKYFHTTEGRGSNCIVEPFRRGQLDYFFAYPQDFSQQFIEWIEGDFERRPHSPAFEVLYVYSQSDGTLDLNFRGANKAIEPLQNMFATEILGLPELPEDPKDTRVYDLNQLQTRDFIFTFEVGGIIQGVTVRKLRLSSKAVKGERITLEADAARGQHAIYELLDRVGPTLPLHAYNVTQVELSVTARPQSSGEGKTMTVRITHPNSCSLKYDELDLALRNMLHASGIDVARQSG